MHAIPTPPDGCVHGQRVFGPGCRVGGCVRVGASVARQKTAHARAKFGAGVRTARAPLPKAGGAYRDRVARAGNSAGRPVHSLLAPAFRPGSTKPHAAGRVAAGALSSPAICCAFTTA